MRSLGAGGDSTNVNVAQVAFARIERVIVEPSSHLEQSSSPDGEGDRLRRLVEQFNRENSNGEA
jgi:hypothetical protein